MKKFYTFLSIFVLSVALFSPSQTAFAKSYHSPYYTNSYGNTVHSPSYSEVVPVGASAQCRDGSYSYSQHRRGTCSHHGGVWQWLY